MQKIHIGVPNVDWKALDSDQKVDVARTIIEQATEGFTYLATLPTEQLISLLLEGMKEKIEIFFSNWENLSESKKDIQMRELTRYLEECPFQPQGASHFTPFQGYIKVITKVMPKNVLIEIMHGAIFDVFKDWDNASIEEKKAIMIELQQFIALSPFRVHTAIGTQIKSMVLKLVGGENNSQISPEFLMQTLFRFRVQGLLAHQ